MWAFQSIFESNTKPRYFEVSDFLILMLLSRSSMCGGIEILVKWTIWSRSSGLIYDHIYTLLLLSLSKLQIWMAARYREIIHVEWYLSLLSLGKFVTILFNFSMKKVGLTTLLWGMPSVWTFVSDRIWLSLTLKFLSLKSFELVWNSFLLFRLRVCPSGYRVSMSNRILSTYRIRLLRLAHCLLGSLLL